MKKNKQIIICLTILVLSILTVFIAGFVNAPNSKPVIVLAGIISGLAMVGIILAVTKKGDNAKCEYDERQIVARGVAFKYGFFSCLIYNLIFGTFSLAKIEIPVNNGIILLTGIFIPTLVFVGISIFKDAYFSLNEKKTSLLIVFGVIAFMNLVSGIMNIFSGTVMVDGKLAEGALNLICAFFLLIILSMLVVKAIYDKRQEN